MASCPSSVALQSIEPVDFSIPRAPYDDFPRLIPTCFFALRFLQAVGGMDTPAASIRRVFVAQCSPPPPPAPPLLVLEVFIVLES